MSSITGGFNRKNQINKINHVFLIKSSHLKNHAFSPPWFDYSTRHVHLSALTFENLCLNSSLTVIVVHTGVSHEHGQMCIKTEFGRPGMQYFIRSFFMSTISVAVAFLLFHLARYKRYIRCVLVNMSFWELQKLRHTHFIVKRIHKRKERLGEL